MSHIKLMIDENLWSVTDLSNKLSGKITASTTKALGFKSGTADNVLVRATNTNGHMLLTLDKKSITRKTYPPCQHGGIILFLPRQKSDETKAGIIRKFLLSGYRRHAIHGVTHLRADGADIYTHEDPAVPISITF